MRTLTSYFSISLENFLKMSSIFQDFWTILCCREMESQSDEQMMDGATVKRRFYTQSNFDLANDRRKQTSTVRQEVCNKLKEYFTPTRACCKKSLLSFFPFIDILRTYSIGTDLLGDIVSGLTIGVMHIPQGKWLTLYAKCSHMHHSFMLCYIHRMAVFGYYIVLYTELFIILYSAVWHNQK